VEQDPKKQRLIALMCNPAFRMRLMCMKFCHAGLFLEIR
jgi:hypothetical protein